MSRTVGLTTQKNYRFLLFGYSFVIVSLGILFAGLLVLWSLPSDLGEGYHNVQAVLRAIQQILFFRITLLYGITTLLIVAAMVKLHLLYSHRIAGPAYRIGLEASRVAQGNLAGMVRFREHDNLMDMADSMNTVVSNFKAHVTSLSEKVSIIEEQSAKLADLVQQGGDQADIARATGEISRCNTEMAVCLSDLRT